MRQVVLNKGYCPKCKDQLVSHHRHDYVTCRCGASSLDGGTEYIRWLGDTITEPVYSDDDFELVRKSAERGGRGLNGDQPLTWTKICDMNDDWLQAVLDYGAPEWHLEIIRKEIEWRSLK